MTRDEEPRYYTDPDYVDPFVKGWRKYREAVDRLYARIDPDIPERVGVRIRSFFVISLCFALAAAIAIESTTDILLYYYVPPTLLALSSGAITFLQERSKSIFGPETARGWPLRGWGGATYLLCFATFVAAIKTRFPGTENGSTSVHPVYVGIVLVLSFAFVIAAAGWIVSLERRFRVSSGDHQGI